MGNLGTGVYDDFSFLEKFSADVSKLVTLVEENLKNERLIALGDAATFWDHSRAFYAPGQWLPKYIIRHYTEDLEPEAKRAWKAPWLLFFAVYLYPDEFRQPVAAWGSITQAGAKSFWNLLKSAEVYRKDPQFLTSVPTKEWTEVKDLPDSFSTFKYQSTWLTELKDAKTVDSVVIEPLVKEANILKS